MSKSINIKKIVLILLSLVVVGIVVSIFSFKTKIKSYKSSISGKQSEVIINYQRIADLIPSISAELHKINKVDTKALTQIEGEKKYLQKFKSLNFGSPPEYAKFDMDMVEMRGIVDRLVKMGIDSKVALNNPKFNDLVSIYFTLKTELVEKRKKLFFENQKYNIAVRSKLGKLSAVFFKIEEEPFFNPTNSFEAVK